MRLFIPPHVGRRISNALFCLAIPVCITLFIFAINSLHSHFAEKRAARDAVAAEKLAAERALNNPTIENVLDAMVRSASNLPQICWDGGSVGFVVQSEDKEWFFIPYSEQKMMKSQNGTWFTGNVYLRSGFEVHPDVSGLECRVHGKKPQ